MGKSTESTFAIFGHRVFAVLWMATLISNIGTWMFNVTAGWLMTTLTHSSLMVSLVQASTALPIFLFALPAGALGDIFERRILLLITQTIAALIMLIFTGLLWRHYSHPVLLLLFTFLSGMGAAFANPTWQAIIPNIVPKHQLSTAVALNGVSINVARAVGPALGGFILAAVGPVFTVLLNALSFIAVIFALLWWKDVREFKDDTLPREHVLGAMRSGVRFVLSSVALRHTIIRAIAFFLFAAAYWALLPLVAKKSLSGGPGLYGSLLTALGSGAILGAFLLPGLKKKISMNQIVALGTLITAVAMLIFAYGKTAFAGMIAGSLAGISWLLVVSALNVSVLLSLPDWMRARGLAIFQMMLFGALTFGSILWGHVAGEFGLSKTLMVAASCSVLGIILTWRFKLNLDEKRDYSLSAPWPDPVLAISIAPSDGPVLITIDYTIAKADRAKFIDLICELGVIRRRDGAMQWGFFEDVVRPDHFIEIFMVESWVAHLRQHRRVTAADKALHEALRVLNQDHSGPSVIHAVTPYRDKKVKPLPKKHSD